MNITKQKMMGRGVYTYDFDNDFLIYKIDEVDYYRSIEHEDLVIDFSKKGLLSGIRVFDASVVFGVSKEALKSVSNFKLITKIAKNGISLRITFETKKQSKIKTYEQSFVTQAVNQNILDSDMVYTV